MKKYMKPALTAAQLESSENVLLTMSNTPGDGQYSKRYEEDEFLEFIEVEDNMNPWKRNK